ncbi:SMP-30/gluconolactonase/LRE family protein [Rhodococcus wratislaviensis]|uniref:Putative lactone hydrolase n=1 Tax=Rhodococcus wratislaviensis NBRC 100605 TaxID=1219028 RepID=X0Q4T7_RHOWR|nr:SMP-30/gluconolactonase/LRE family protein [Rhodococcus wratislaviensis]GAF45516.1 putative lactone hydrolase [Rhodococcus wratislaviensis NBRC 100605]
MSRDLRVVLTGHTFLESPRWHEGRIWVTDFFTNQILSATETGADLRVEAVVPQQPSGIGWLPDGRLVVVSMRDHRLLRREVSGALVTHAYLGDRACGFPNDMVVAADGRAYVGNFGFDLQSGAPMETAVLLCVDPDGAVTEVADDLWFPNGMVISDDGSLIVGESFGNRVTEFDIQPDGGLTGRRDFARFGPLPTVRAIADFLPGLSVTPDGCCLDADGALWVADAVNGRVLRVVRGGEIVDTIEPGAGVFACMLGGADGRTLFMCAAPDSDEEARSAARDAQLLATTVDVPRAGRP